MSWGQVLRHASPSGTSKLAQELIEAAHYSATAAGAAMLHLPLVLSLTLPLMGGLTGRIGPRLSLRLSRWSSRLEFS